MGNRLHDWFVTTWYGRTRRGAWLLPLAALFAGISVLRRWLYRGGILPTYRSTRLVVVVGNLTVGGAGKTPLVMWLAGELTRRGLRVGVALRGYGSAHSAARRIEPGDQAVEAGDEALVIRRRVNIPVAIGASRAEAVQLLENDCDAIVCDDGLQHYALARDFEIAVIDGMRGFGNGWRLPAGPLREPVARLEEVDAVVVNGAGHERRGALRMTLEPVAVVSLGDGSRRSLSELAGRHVVAAAAIGNPERFFAMLRAHGLSVETRALPDHARFTPELAGVGSGKPVLLTEKDAVKCVGPGWDGAAWVEVVPRIDTAGAMALVDAIVGKAAGRTGDLNRD
jgi:tetraacyldisaccharide 4'-kinase